MKPLPTKPDGPARRSADLAHLTDYFIDADEVHADSAPPAAPCEGPACAP